NLDALWDELSSRKYPISIKIVNLDEMIKQLGAYSEKLIEVLTEVGMYNKGLIIDFNADKDLPV
ncbi:MAG TPA: barstar family protein, partial [Fusibacter sp.]|nr:barstar family protein [Fusibacter sp.]